MREEFEKGLFEILRREIGDYEPTFGITDDLSDDESCWSVLVDITFPAYPTDDGVVTLSPINMEFRFDKDCGDYWLITGEDNEHEITKATLFACAYFYSWQDATALQAERVRGLEDTVQKLSCDLERAMNWRTEPETLSATAREERDDDNTRKNRSR